MGLQKRGKQRNVSTNKTSSLVVGHTKHGIFPWAQGAFSACLKRSKDSWKRHAKWKRRNHHKNCEGRQICINHMVCHHPPLVKQLIFSILVGFWNFFCSISPFALHQFYRRTGLNIEAPDEDHTQLIWITIHSAIQSWKSVQTNQNWASSMIFCEWSFELDEKNAPRCRISSNSSVLFRSFWSLKKRWETPTEIWSS